MNTSLRRQESGTQQTSDDPVNLQTFDGILHWLARLIQLTEEEKIDAGIYIGNQPSQEILTYLEQQSNENSDDMEKI